MTTITIADVLKNLDEQLAWRGPNGRVMGHIVFDRAQAESLRDWMLMICKECDELRGLPRNVEPKE